MSYECDNWSVYVFFNVMLLSSWYFIRSIVLQLIIHWLWLYLIIDVFDTMNCATKFETKVLNFVALNIKDVVKVLSVVVVADAR